MNTPILLETLARQALAGDREALDRLVRALQDDIYRLALRMLWNREDAEDATQEILVRIVTRLSQFGFRSQLKTWAYRLSVNYILDLKKSPIERLDLTFQRFADNLIEGIEPASADETEPTPSSWVVSVLFMPVSITRFIGRLDRGCERSAARLWQRSNPRSLRVWRKSPVATICRPFRPAYRRSHCSGSVDGQTQAKTRQLLSIMPGCGCGGSRHPDGSLLRSLDRCLRVSETRSCNDRSAHGCGVVEDHPGVLSKVIFNVFSDDDRETYAAALEGRTFHAAI